MKEKSIAWPEAFFASAHISINKERSLRILTDTLIVLLAYHAYGIMNYLPSHDGVMVVAVDAAWQISLGRFTQPFYELLRGAVAAPWLIAILTLFFLTGAYILMLDLLNIKNRIVTFLMIAVLTSHMSFLVGFGVFMNWMDIYGLSLLLAVSGVWILDKTHGIPGLLLSALCFLLSMGLYQCYMAAAASLCLLLLMRDCMAGGERKARMRKLVRYLLGAGTGAAGYLAVVRLSSVLSGIPLSGSYNSISNLTNTADGQGRSAFSYLSLIPKMYTTFFSYFTEETGYNTAALRLIFAVLVLLGAAAWAWWMRKKKIRADRAGELGIYLILSPMAMNCIYILTGGMVHILMLFSYHMVLLFLFLPLIFETEARRTPAEGTHEDDAEHGKNFGTGRRLSQAALLFTAVICVYNLVYDNGFHYYRKIVGDASQYQIFTVLQDLERDPEYEPGETPVVLIGEILASDMNFKRHDFAQFEDVPYSYGSAATYYLSFTQYANFMMGKDIVLGDNTGYAEQDRVREMPCYPKDGYCQMIDGAMVVKLSDPSRQ